MGGENSSDSCKEISNLVEICCSADGFLRKETDLLPRAVWSLRLRLWSVLKIGLYRLFERILALFGSTGGTISARRIALVVGPRGGLNLEDFSQLVVGFLRPVRRCQANRRDWADLHLRLISLEKPLFAEAYRL